ncbi:unnamed protein product, partial [Closterium sp. NIES-54]
KEAEMTSYRSTGTYVDVVPPPGMNVVSGMWLLKVQRSPQSPPVFKARVQGALCGERLQAARTIALTQSHMVEPILTRFRFRFSKVQPTHLAVDHGLMVPPSDEPFESNSPYPELVGCLFYLMTYTRPDLAYPLSVLARFVAPGRHRPSHWYAAKRVTNCKAEVYATAVAAQELRWLYFLLTDLGERPRSPLVLFADNRSAVPLCKEL